MVNDIGVTEIPLQPHDQWWKDHQESSQPRAAYRLVADPVTHDGRIMQSFADRQKPSQDIDDSERVTGRKARVSKGRK